MSDVAVITHRIGNIYLGGPPLVKAATGEVVTGEELGGATMHCSVSGITDHFAKDEEESFAITRDVIASLNLSPTPPVELGGTPPLYSSEGLEVLAGKKVLEKEDVMALLARITDNSRFFEFKAMFGGNLICGFGRLFGQLTGFLVNSGPITAVMGPELTRNPVSWPKSLPKPQIRFPPNIALNSKNLLLSVILARSAMTSSFSKAFLPARTSRPSEE